VLLAELGGSHPVRHHRSCHRTGLQLRRPLAAPLAAMLTGLAVGAGKWIGRADSGSGWLFRLSGGLFLLLSPSCIGRPACFWLQPVGRSGSSARRGPFRAGTAQRSRGCGMKRQNWDRPTPSADSTARILRLALAPHLQGQPRRPSFISDHCIGPVTVGAASTRKLRCPDLKPQARLRAAPRSSPNLEVLQTAGRAGLEQVNAQGSGVTSAATSGCALEKPQRNRSHSSINTHSHLQLGQRQTAVSSRSPTRANRHGSRPRFR